MTDPTYDTIHATSPTQLRALGHPTRHKLLRALGPDGATISQLTNRLGINKGNVAHHLDVLRQAGLVRKGPTRTVRGGTEQYFVKTGRKYVFDAGDEGATTKALLGSIVDDLIADPDHLLHHRVLRLTQAHARALNDHLDALVDGLNPANSRESEYGVFVGLYRTSERPTSR